MICNACEADLASIKKPMQKIWRETSALHAATAGQVNLFGMSSVALEDVSFHKLADMHIRTLITSRVVTYEILPKVLSMLQTYVQIVRILGLHRMLLTRHGQSCGENATCYRAADVTVVHQHGGINQAAFRTES